MLSPLLPNFWNCIAGSWINGQCRDAFCLPGGWQARKTSLESSADKFVLCSFFCLSNPSTLLRASNRTKPAYLMDGRQETQVLPHNLNKILRHPPPQMKRTRSHNHGNSNSFSFLCLPATLIFKGYGERTFNKIHICVHFFACPKKSNLKKGPQ